ncbi:MAG: hypothetical protein ABIH23_24320 [bacterium]
MLSSGEVCGRKSRRPNFRIILMGVLVPCLAWANGLAAAAQTLIHPSQIEDAYLLNTGDVSTGDIVAATSSISAATLVVSGSEAICKMFTALDGDQEVVWFGSNGFDIRIDPNYLLPEEAEHTAHIRLATAVEFDDILGDKITFWSHCYKVGVSSYDLDFTSDRNFKFHSDTVENLFQILGDEGNAVSRNNITA